MKRRRINEKEVVKIQQLLPRFTYEHPGPYLFYIRPF